MGYNVALFQDVAAGAIQGDGTVRKQRGCVVARTGVGTYTITINPAIVNGETVTQQGNISGGVPQAECACEVQPVGATALTAQVTHTSNTVKTVIISNAAGAAADSDFEFRIRRLLG